MRRLVLIFPIALLGLLGCELQPTAAAKAESDPLQGTWEEYPPEPVAWFEGAFLDFDIRGDSVFIAEEHWTDVIICNRAQGDTTPPVCSDNQWINYYAGDIAIGESNLIMNIRYTGTSANAMTRPNNSAGAATAFRWKRGPEPGKVELEKTGGDEFIWRKTHLLLRRKT